jgi:hypothetical protein
VHNRASLAFAAFSLFFAVGTPGKTDDHAIVTYLQSQTFSDPQQKRADLKIIPNEGEVALDGAAPSNAGGVEMYRVTSDAEITSLLAMLDIPVAQAVPPPPQQPRDVVIPENTIVSIRMIDGVDSSVNHAGEIFHASLEAPLVVGDTVVVPQGADVYVRLTAASSAGHMKGKSELHLELVKMDFEGRSYPMASDTYSEVGSSRGQSTAKKVAGGAVVGALLGGLLGGGKGAAIGAGVGAGGGAVYQGATKGKRVKVPRETKLDFQLSQPLTVTVMPRAASQAE